MEKSEEFLKLETSVNAALDKETDPDYLSRYAISIVGTNLKEALQSLRPQIEERHRIKSDKEGLFNVIHYTSVDALTSMIRNTSEDNDYSLRLYDSIHLNDPGEGKYLVRDLIREYKWLEGGNPTHAYIASFITPNSETASDNLVFWRAYGDEGEGCAMAFRVPSILKQDPFTTSFPVTRGQLMKVLYGDDEAENTVKLLKPILNSLDPLANIFEESLCKKVQATWAKIVWKFLGYYRYLYKSKAYKYEDECRFVLAESDIQNKDEISFELQDQNNFPSRIRHYCVDKNLAIKKLLVTGSSITIGPCITYQYNMSYYLKDLMRKAGLPGPEIKISKISYRKP